MLLELLFNLISGVINLIPFELPQMPGKFQSVLDMLFAGMLDGLQLIGIFIDLSFWISCAIAMTVVYNIKHVWNTIVWCLNLIPAVSISQWK